MTFLHIRQKQIPCMWTRHCFLIYLLISSYTHILFSPLEWRKKKREAAENPRYVFLQWVVGAPWAHQHCFPSLLSYTRKNEEKASVTLFPICLSSSQWYQPRCCLAHYWLTGLGRKLPFHTSSIFTNSASCLPWS